MCDYDQEMEDEYGAQFGDPRRCPVHPHFFTSSRDGMFDAPCPACEGEMEEASRADEAARDGLTEGLNATLRTVLAAPDEWTDDDEIPF